MKLQEQHLFNDNIQSGKRWGFPLTVISMAVIALITLTVLTAVFTTHPAEAKALLTHQFSSNPELSVAQRHSSAKAKTLDAGDVMAFRWLAMARGYERLGMLNTTMDAGDVMAFRWLAMARGYERLGMLNGK